MSCRQKGCKIVMGLVVVLLTSYGAAQAVNVSFTGTFGQDDAVQFFTFTADGVSTVTLRSSGYAGGTQADGHVLSAGGFDPGLAMFDATGVLLVQQDDDIEDTVCDGNTDLNTGQCWDVFFT